MKQLIILLTISVFIFGCGKNQQQPPRTLADNARDVLVERLNDPVSFEFISEELVDSTTIRKNIEMSRLLIGDLDFYKRYMKDEYKKNAAILAALDSVEREFDSANVLDSVVSYTYYITYRANNAFGAKMLNGTYVQISPSGNLIKLASEINELALIPGEFPGYDDIFANR